MYLFRERLEQFSFDAKNNFNDDVYIYFLFIKNLIFP